MGSVITNIWSGTLLIFVILKLVGLVAWSWWWVLSPVLFGPAFELFAFGLWEIYNDAKGGG
jgi:hypothetical protein